MNQYLIPANSKKGQLIFSIFRPIDLGILIGGGFVTLLLMFALKGDNLIMTFIKLLPLGSCVLLVMPIPYYHNVLVFLEEFFIYIMEQKEYCWKGWCASDGVDEQK